MLQIQWLKHTTSLAPVKTSSANVASGESKMFTNKLSSYNFLLLVHSPVAAKHVCEGISPQLSSVEFTGECQHAWHLVLENSQSTGFTQHKGCITALCVHLCADNDASTSGATAQKESFTQVIPGSLHGFLSFY